jgi:hypothetical protein
LTVFSITSSACWNWSLISMFCTVITEDYTTEHFAIE